MSQSLKLSSTWN